MTAEQRAADILAATVQDGGITYEARTLIPFRPVDGYAVGIAGAKLDKRDATVQSIAYLSVRLAQEHGTTYAGTWMPPSGVFVYVDAVEYFGEYRMVAAMERARAAGQEAMYDFRAGKSIPVTYSTEAHDR